MFRTTYKNNEYANFFYKETNYLTKFQKPARETFFQMITA